MGTRRSLGAPPGCPAALPPLPQGALPAAAAGRSGTAHLRASAPPAAQALSTPGQPVSPRGDGGGRPLPWMVGRQEPAETPGLDWVVFPVTSASSGLARLGSQA